jgi:hypothetical protein
MVDFWNSEDLINQDAIEAMTEDQLATVLGILERAGY